MKVAERPQISAVVNVHGEGALVWQTLMSVDIALKACLETGTTAELIILGDRISTATQGFIDRWLANNHNSQYPQILITVDRGDLGLARNAAVEHSNGEVIAFIDGDDLVSENYLVEMSKAIQGSSKPTIFHSEYLIIFGDRKAIWKIRSSNSAGMSYLKVLGDNLWPSSCAARREIFEEFKYSELKPEDGFGPEDWYWNIETLSAGIPHEIVPDTILFYRTRPQSGLNVAHSSSLLPSINFDKLRKMFPIGTAKEVNPTQPNRRLRRVIRLISHGSIRILKVLAKPISRLSPAAVQWSKNKLISVYMLFRKESFSEYPEKVHQLIQKATWIEPEITGTAEIVAKLPEWQPFESHYAELLEEFVDQFNARTIIAAPWIGIGGADLVALNLANVFEVSAGSNDSVLIVTTGDSTKTVDSLIPSNIRRLQFDSKFESLPEALQRRLIAQALVQAQPERLVIINSYQFLQALRTFGRQVSAKTAVYTSLFCLDRTPSGHPDHNIFVGGRDFLENIEGVITDNAITARELQSLLGFDDEFFKVIYQPVEIPTGSIRTGPQLDKKIKLLWPHRLDKQKRPDALESLATAVKSMGLPVEIHVFGGSVFEDATQLIATLQNAGIIYRGEYSGGLMSLPLEEFDALLITSDWEGLPNAALQAAAAGLPIISTEVGGITDLISDKESGFIISNAADIDGFISCVESILAGDHDLREISNAALEVIATRHSWDAFAKSVLKELPTKSAE